MLFSVTSVQSHLPWGSLVFISLIMQGLQNVFPSQCPSQGLELFLFTFPALVLLVDFHVIV